MPTKSFRVGATAQVLRPVLLTLLSIQLAVACSASFANNHSTQGQNSMGVYNVGRLSTDWPLSPDDPTSDRLQVEWWYPTTATKGGPDYLYSKDLKSALVTYMGMPSFAISNREKGAGLRGVEPAAGTFPLVVFNHGFASFSRQNNRQAEALAAAGFVVASLSYPEHSLTTEYSTGEVVGIDADHPALQSMRKGADKRKEKKDLLAQLDTLNQTFAKLAAATSAADFEAAIDELRSRTMFAMNLTSAESRVSALVGFIESLLAAHKVQAGPALLAHLKLDHIGLYGHSLGGVVSVAAAQQLLDKGVSIGGVVSLDVPQFILPATNPTQLAGNGCFVMGGATKFGRKKPLQGTGLNRYLATTNPGFCEINIDGAAHQNFTDLSWVTPLKWFGQLGSVSNKKFGRWLNGFMVAYMQHHLQGRPYDYPAWPGVEVVGNIERESL